MLMEITYKIRAMAVFVFLTGLYVIIMQITGFYLIGTVLFYSVATKITFGFTTCSLIMSFLLSILLLFGSYMLFKLKQIEANGQDINKHSKLSEHLTELS